MPSRSGRNRPKPMPPLSSPPMRTLRASMRSATYLKPMAVSWNGAPRARATFSTRRVVGARRDPRGDAVDRVVGDAHAPRLLHVELRPQRAHVVLDQVLGSHRAPLARAALAEARGDFLICLGERRAAVPRLELD